VTTNEQRETATASAEDMIPVLPKPTSNKESKEITPVRERQLARFYEHLDTVNKKEPDTFQAF
jgi:hypothetical protein